MPLRETPALLALRQSRKNDSTPLGMRAESFGSERLMTPIDPEDSPDSKMFVTQLVANTRRIYVFIATLIPLAGEVDDVYQQTCLALWQKRHLYDPERPFFQWACGFARNEALRHLRSSRTARLRLSEKTLDAIAAEQIRSESAHGNGRQSALEDCLEELHVRQRMLLQRCYTGDEPIREIAAEIGVSPAALTMRLQRIRHALVRCIDQALSKVEAVS